MSAIDAKKQILIVDGNVATGEPLRQKLCAAGFQARSIADCALAAAEIAENPPQLLIIDWNVPGYATLDLINGLRLVPASRPIRLIIISALASERDVVAGFALGADDFVAKPFSLLKWSPGSVRCCGYAASRGSAPRWPVMIWCWIPRRAA